MYDILIVQAAVKPDREMSRRIKEHYMPVLRVIQSGIIKEIVFEGEFKLSELIENASVYPDMPCGGHGICKKCTVVLDGREVLACRCTVKDDAEVIIPEEKYIASLTGAGESGRVTDNVCLCLDIGTTTLALALVSTDEKKVIKQKTAPNPQRRFGADVISRIEHCTKRGTAELQRVLLDKLKQMTAELLEECGVSSVTRMYVAGNTTMLHLFFGVDCSSLGVSPYTPAFLDEKRAEGAEMGLENIGEVISLPGIAAFVGADIVSGLGYIDKPTSGRRALFIDLGTNAEIALFDGDRYLCTAAAAGPCFEGANISSGMSASNGAVSRYFADGSYSVIGNGLPEGICATGLVDVIAELVRRGDIDESGYMEEDFCLSDKVEVTADDVREFQLAKSAVRSAVDCLLRMAEIEYGDVEKMYVSGGFSAGLNVENAAFLGLVPSELSDAFVPLNNSSLLGCVKYACEKNDLADIVRRAEYIDLGANDIFTKMFFDNMAFDGLK